MISTLERSVTTINIATQFSEVPGPRSRDEGPDSGQEFLETLLLPAFREAVENKGKVYINLDGTEGYATSFLESSFGGLARMYNPEQVLQILEFKSDEEPYLIEEIKIYIREAQDK